ncbi:phospholipid scramblase 2-like [Dermacentor albipictus]|uniref:phospholipid scramblase 2-like n=1 Tax=Dermacentor albipictus TaxID=60249 RepID=UPI0038FCA163
MAQQKAASASRSLQSPQSAPPGGSGHPLLLGHMPKPATSVVCPPGLEYLTVLDQIILDQQGKIAEAVGVEIANSYVVRNSSGQLIYCLNEDSTCCTRNCCGPFRCFVMNVMDQKNDVVMRFVRYLRLPCSYICCCRQAMQVQAPPGNVISDVRQRWSIWYPTFAIYDPDGMKQLEVVGGLCTSSLPCKCDVDFEVRSTNGAVVGKVTRKWGGLFSFTDADTFGVKFPMDLDVRTKSALMAVTLLIDYMYYEDCKPACCG